jgi:hypothetical protein
MHSLADRQDMIIDERMGVELPAGVWFPEPVREMTIFAEQYDLAVTLLLLENQYSYTRFDREPVKDVWIVSRRRCKRAASAARTHNPAGASMPAALAGGHKEFCSVRVGSSKWRACAGCPWSCCAGLQPSDHCAR